MAPANHIQAAVSWFASAGEPTKCLLPRSGKYCISHQPTTVFDYRPCRVTASCCKSLVTADLRGFTITEEALTSLVSNNGQLREITLPGGCSRDQLQPLRRLTALQCMTLEAPTGDITECLPENLLELDIAGEWLRWHMNTIRLHGRTMVMV